MCADGNLSQYHVRLGIGHLKLLLFYDKLPTQLINGLGRFHQLRQACLHPAQVKHMNSYDIQSLTNQIG